MLTNKLRLYIIYALIFIAIVGAAIGVAAKFEAKDIALEMEKHQTTINDQATKIEGLLDENRQHSIAMAEVLAAQAADDTVLSGLQSDLRALNIQRASIMDKISYMEQSNEQVRSYLDSPVPPDGCVLDNSCEGRPNPRAASPETPPK